MKNKTFKDKLLTKLKAEFETEIVPVDIEEYSTQNNCFYNVQKKIAIDKGKIHYGWILHSNEFFYEAERHSVWENSVGDLIDITPSQKYNDKITFLSDNNFEYKGQYTGNVRVNITNNKVVDDYIYILEKIDSIKALFIKKNEKDIDYPIEIRDAIEILINQSNSYYTFIKVHKASERTKCFCGKSDKSYKNCHGKIMKSEISEFVKKATKAYC